MRAPVAVRVPFCGLPCAPLLVQPGTDPLIVEGGCAVARAAAARRTDPGGPRVDGMPATFEAAVDRAVAILGGARRPHVGGLAWSTVETARRAARLARRLGGSIDIEGSDRLRGEIEATQQSGLVGATFGAVRDRADVVLLWRVDPRAEHPEFLPDPITLDGAPRARRVIALAPAGAPASTGADLEALATLRAAVAGSTGATTAGFAEAAASLREARFAAILWSAEAARGAGGTAVVTALGRLVRDLEAGGRRAVGRSLGAAGDVAGAMSALLSETGLPRAVRYESPGGAAGPDPFDGVPPAERGGALLLVGPRESSAGGRAGVIIVGPDLPDGSSEPDVFIPTALPGLSGRGTWLRADGVAAPVRGPITATAPLEEDVLDRLAERLPARAAEVA
jgi:formylmethanofuran dehydrogenase subunit B